MAVMACRWGLEEPTVNFTLAVEAAPRRNEPSYSSERRAEESQEEHWGGKSFVVYSGQSDLLNWHYNELQRLQDLNEIILEKDSIVQGLQDEVRFRAPHNSQDETFLRWLNWQAKKAKCSRAVFIRFHLVLDNKLCQYSLPGSADWCSILGSCWTQQPHDTSGLWMKYGSVFQWQTEY